MSAQDFVKQLQANGVLSSDVAAKVLKQVAQSEKKVDAQKIAKLLIKAGRIDEAQAKKALAQLAAANAPDAVEVLDDVVEPVSVETLDGGFEPMDADNNADVHGDSVLAEETAAPSQKSSSKFKKKRYATNRWDSPLMLVGGGGLLFLLMIGGFIYLFLTKGSADDAFREAEQLYRDESYGQAIQQFERFQADFKNDEKISSAAVYVGMAKIWSEVERKNWEKSLEVARQQLPELLNQEAFAQARPELQTLLPDIMDGFAEKALNADSMEQKQSFVDMAAEAFQEVNNTAYLAPSFRKAAQARIDEIQGKIAIAERDINRDKELALRLDEINQALAQNDTRQAYSIRKDLLRKYPKLGTNDQLKAIVANITAKERERVQVMSDPPAATTQDIQTNSEFSVALASVRGESLAANAQDVLFIRALGAVYGVKADSGEVLWRRFVGTETTVDPMRIRKDAGSDAIIVDTRRNELVRLAAATGKVIWRLPCPGKPLAPSVVGNQVYLTCSGPDESGSVLTIDVNSGAVTQGATFAMNLSSGIGAQSDSAVAYQVGNHSSVYQLDRDSFSCTDVIYLGHAAGTVVVPPVMILGHVLIAENPGPGFSVLHLLGPDPENEGQLKEIIDPIRLSGQVTVPMTVFGRRAMVATSGGGIDVFELDPNQAAEPFRRVVESVIAANSAGIISYPYFEDGRLWVGDTQLTRYDLQASRGKLLRRWIKFKGDRFAGSLHRTGDAIVGLRQVSGKAGLTLAAFRIDDRDERLDGEPVWTTELATHPAGDIFIHAKKINVVSASGDLFSLGGSELKSGVVNKPVQSVPTATPLNLIQMLEWSDGNRAFFADPTGDSFVRFDAAQSRLSPVMLQTDGDAASSRPVPFGNGILYTGQSGAVYLLNPQTGGSLVHAFQPTVSVGSSIQWPRPAIQQDAAILSDGQKRLLKLQVVNQPQPHLDAALQSDTELQPIAPLAVAGERVYTVQRDVGADSVVAIQTSDLQPINETWDLNGRISYGPVSVAGKLALLSTDAGELAAYGGNGPLWKIDFPHGDLAGDPAVSGSDLLVCTVQGKVVRIAAATGQELGMVDIGEPLDSGVVLFGSRIVVVGGDGTIHVAAAP
ncbi:MAG: PQQ-binding-like beta-propeller repeat protein [Planctomycetales bacterium]|nr:PQQ-binding-like beta-propeller repeat protein [Planctomycetales bacterium]